MPYDDDPERVLRPLNMDNPCVFTILELIETMLKMVGGNSWQVYKLFLIQ